MSCIRVEECFFNCEGDSSGNSLFSSSSSFFLFMFWGIEGPTSLLLYDFSITWRISLGLFNAYLANKPLLHLVLREKL